MPVIFDKVINGNRTRIFYESGKTYYEYYNGHNISKTLLCDEFGNELEDIQYDHTGKEISHFCREYKENGFIETFKNKSEDYIRSLNIKFLSGYIQVLDKFNSLTHPEKNYIKVFLYDKNNNLIRVINNGKMELYI